MPTPVSAPPEVQRLANDRGIPAILQDLFFSSFADLPAPVPGQGATDNGAKLPFDCILVLEDILQSARCFVSGFDGRPSSAAAYMTIMDYAGVKSVLEVVGRDRFSRNQWREVVRYYRWNISLSPVLGLLSAEIARFAGLPSPLSGDPEAAAFYGENE